VLDEVAVSGLAERFLETVLGSGQGFRIGRGEYGVATPDSVVLRRFSELPVPESDGTVHPAGRIRLGTVETSDSTVIGLRHAVGVEGEVRGVLREVLSRELPLENVEIVYTSEDPYLSHFVNLTDLLQIPVRYSDGIPVRWTRPGQAVAGFLKWIYDGRQAADLVEMLRCGFVMVSGTNPGRISLDLAEILERRHAGAGRAECRAAFAREWAASVDESIGGTPRAYRKDRIKSAEEALEKLLSLVPDSPRASVAILVGVATQFLQRFTRLQTDRDILAAESISRRLERLASAVDAEDRLETVARTLAEVLRNHRMGAAVADAGALHIVPISRAGYSGRDYTFYVGLDETSFPGASTEDPLLLDDERSLVASGLPHRSRRPVDQTWHLMRSMGMASGEVVLVARRYDLVHGKEVYPTSIFEECREALGTSPIAEYAAVNDHAGGLTATERWLSRRSRHDYRGMLEDRYPALHRGEEAAAGRSNPAISVFSGELGLETPELRLDTAGITTSASGLETLARCPYRYFLRHVLKIRPPDSDEPPPGRWLTPLQFGLLVHEFLLELMTAARENGEAVTRDRYGDLAKELLEERIKRWRSALPPRSEVGYQADVRRLGKVAEIFLVTEETMSDGTPWAFEYAFGRGRGRGEDNDSVSAVEIHLGEGRRVMLSGSIDRVDRTLAGYRIWDYKTGSSWRYKATDLLARGTLLQWALYGYVIQTLEAGSAGGAMVETSGYYFVSEGDPGRLVAQRLPDAEAVGTLLDPLFRMIGKGAFTHHQKGSIEACAYCDFKTVCQKERRGDKDLPPIDGSNSRTDVLAVLVHEWMTG
jgi:ATP-dependent helicase/nuclease subunit B